MSLLPSPYGAVPAPFARLDAEGNRIVQRLAGFGARHAVLGQVAGVAAQLGRDDIADRCAELARETDGRILELIEEVKAYAGLAA